jgi:melanoma-associated antigen
LPSSGEEAEFVGFYSFVIALICLSSGELSDVKLRDYLTRVNADENLPFDKTKNVLAKLVRLGYLDKVVEKSDGGDEDTITWCVGTRAKAEVPPESIAVIVKHIWRDDPPNDLNKRINKSLGLQGNQQLVDEDEEGEDGEGEEEDEGEE